MPQRVGRKQLKEEQKARIERAKKDYGYMVSYYFPHYATAKSADFHIEFARETARLEAINAYLISTLNNVDSAISEKENLMKHIDAIRLVSVFATEESSKIIRFAYDRAGTRAIHSENILGRIFRDFHVASQHLLIDITQYQKLGIKMLDLK